MGFAIQFSHWRCNGFCHGYLCGFSHFMGFAIQFNHCGYNGFDYGHDNGSGGDDDLSHLLLAPHLLPCPESESRTLPPTFGPAALIALGKTCWKLVVILISLTSCKFSVPKRKSVVGKPIFTLDFINNDKNAAMKWLNYPRLSEKKQLHIKMIFLKLDVDRRKLMSAIGPPCAP